MLQGRYQPLVRRVTIPKPAGGTRNLGIPTAIDRVIQQAVLQQLQPLWDPTFSEHSYGFRPGRSAHQAVAQAQAYVIAGYQFVVDIDLAKFFDRVNHDRLVAAVAARVSDRRLLRLIRSYLTAGVLDNGLFETNREGVPQGGPLSPLLSNLVLDELDRELERRGHRFVRYAPLLANVYLHYVFDLWAERWRRREARGDMMIVRYSTIAPHHRVLDSFRRKERFGRQDPWANGLPGGESQRGP